MPQKNVDKHFQNMAFFHVYNHFVDGLKLFNDEQYCNKFLQLVDRYLGQSLHKDINGMTYGKLNEKVEIAAYCLLPTHFHLLLFQKDDDGITELMHKVGTAMGRYVNLSMPKRRGTIFETTFKAVLINTDSYLWHVSRYIHLNPIDEGRNYINYPWSSYEDYVRAKPRYDWLKKDMVMDLFGGSRQDYAQFVADGVAMHLSRK